MRLQALNYSRENLEDGGCPHFGLLGGLGILKEEVFNSYAEFSKGTQRGTQGIYKKPKERGTHPLATLGTQLN